METSVNHSQVEFFERSTSHASSTSSTHQQSADMQTEIWDLLEEGTLRDIKAQHEVLVRRLRMMLFSMYFDNATTQDWESEAFHSQSCVSDLMQLLGSPWAPARSQVSNEEGDFLGLMHDVSPFLAQRVSGI